jgi:hypothetical protein
MTGAPAEKWRKFQFSTAPGWSYALLALVCAGVVGIIVGIIVQYSVSRRASGHLPLTRASSLRITLATWIPAGLILGAIGLWIVAIIVGAGSAGTSGQVSNELVYTTWVADAKVTGGPEPGFKPALTELTGQHVTSATAFQDPSDSSWNLDLVFDPRGTQLLSDLTRANVAACPGDSNTDVKAQCAERYLTLWLGLTQADIDNWESLSYAADTSGPLDVGCPARSSPSAVCGKLIVNAITLEQIDGGEVLIGGSFTQTDAEELAKTIQTKSTPGNPVGAAIAWGLAGFGLLCFVGGLVGRYAFKPFIGPRAKVMEPPPGYLEQPVELRNVHPAFAAAVLYTQQARAAQYASTYQPQNPPLPPRSN